MRERQRVEGRKGGREKKEGREGGQETETGKKGETNTSGRRKVGGEKRKKGKSGRETFFKTKAEIFISISFLLQVAGVRYWGLNLVPHTCLAVPLPLEPYIWLFLVIFHIGFHIFAQFGLRP
jgi:hypothetical protein